MALPALGSRPGPDFYGSSSMVMTPTEKSTVT